MRTLLVVEHEADAGLDLLAAGLRAAAQLRLLRPYLGDPLPGPDGLSGTSGLVVLGGEMAAWEDDRAPWLPATRALLVAAVRAELPTLGVCLGAQLLAHATGGLAERGTAGPEIGLVEVTPVAGVVADPLVKELGPQPFRSLTYHGDAVTRLPADAELLVTGDRYPIQAFRVGACAWGVQYHPEVSAAGFAAWVRASTTLTDGDRARLLELAAAARETQQALASCHARAFVAAVGLGLPA